MAKILYDKKRIETISYTYDINWNDFYVSYTKREASVPLIVSFESDIIKEQMYITGMLNYNENGQVYFVATDSSKYIIRMFNRSFLEQCAKGYLCN